MLAQQSLATMTGLTVPVLAPAISRDLALDPGLIGAYTAFIYGVSMFASLGGGGFILRYGGLRVSQVSLLFLGLGLLLSAHGHIALFAIGAIAMGLGTGPSTPASSHVLNRYAPPRIAPLVFSIKQTGVPFGGVLAGALIPWFMDLSDWRGALAMTAVLCFGLTLALQPFRGEIDSDRQAGRAISVTDLRAVLSAVVTTPRLRRYAMAIFTFTGIQLAFGSFFVLLLVDHVGLSLPLAGLIFAIGQGAAVPGRIFWGWLASRTGAARLLLAGLALSISAATAGIAAIAPDWPVPAIVAAALIFGLTGISYQGLLLAEIARVSPPGMAGVITGGIVFFAYAGMVLFPVGLGVLLSATGSYALGFWIAAAAAFPVGVVLLIDARRRDD